MVCKKCGAKFDNDCVCTTCGWKVDDDVDGISSVEELIQQDEAEQSEMRRLVLTDEIRNYVKPRKFGMLWHKITVYFSMWLCVVLNFLSMLVLVPWHHLLKLKNLPMDMRLRLLQGDNFTLHTRLDYERYKELNIVALAFFILYLALMVFAIVACIRLIKYKKKSPLLLNLYMGVNAAVPLLYLLVAKIILSDLVLMSGGFALLVQIPIATTLFFVNIFYYHKRKHLFDK